MNARLNVIRARREKAVDLYAAPESRRDARLLLERDDVPAMVAALEAVLAWTDTHRADNGGFECVQARDVHGLIESALATPAQGTTA